MAKKTKEPNNKERPRGGASIPCPRCGGATHVLTTRRDAETKNVTRRRECNECGEKFETQEATV